MGEKSLRTGHRHQPGRRTEESWRYNDSSSVLPVQIPAPKLELGTVRATWPHGKPAHPFHASASGTAELRLWLLLRFCTEDPPGPLPDVRRFRATFGTTDRSRTSERARFARSAHRRPFAVGSRGRPATGGHSGSPDRRDRAFHRSMTCTEILPSGGCGIRTHDYGHPQYRFSRPAHSATMRTLLAVAAEG